MHYELAATVNLGLVPQSKWLWYARRSGQLLVGDAKRAFAISPNHPADAVPLAAERAFPRDVPIQGAGGVPTIADFARMNSHPLNLPIPDVLYDEAFAPATLRGLTFLPRDVLDRAPPDHPVWLGNLLGRLYGHTASLYMLHRPSNLVLNLLGGALQLFQQSPTGFTLVAEARTRGRQAMSFAAHPDEPLLAYVDNVGSSFAQEFSESGFGKTRKIDTWKQGGRAALFLDARTLILGGMGHLAAYGYADHTFAKRSEIAVACRDLLWNEDQQVLLVNQGMHGIAFFRVEDSGFVPCGALKPEGTVQMVAFSPDLSFLATTDQHAAEIRIFRMINGS